MHARHRSPGNGYRSGSLGMGVSASRISPESSGRGHGFYNSEYRNFKRGFGRGKSYSKSTHLPPTPRKGSDIFMEAGRLAAQYLVSQGLLAPSVLSGKWQSNNIKKLSGDFQDFKSQEGDNLNLSQDGRTSALARLGSSASDTAVGRRRYTDYFNSMGSKNHVKGGRRRENFRSDGSDWGGEYGRSGPWLDGTRSSPHTEDSDTAAFERPEDQHLLKDLSNGLQQSGLSESAPKSEEAADLESELQKYNLQNEMGLKPGSSDAEKDLQHESGVEHSKKSDASMNSNGGRMELGDGNSSEENEIKGSSTTEELSIEQNCSVVVEPLCKSSDDLLAVCKFGNVPTRKRSSLALKALKHDPKPRKEEDSASDIGAPRRYEVLVEDDSLGGSSGNLLSQKSHDLKFTDSETSKELAIPPSEKVGGSDYMYGIERVKCNRSQSFPVRAVLHDSEEDLGHGIPGLPRSSSMVDDRGEKRALDQNDMEEVNKKRREWLQPMATMADDFSNLSDIVEKKGGSDERSDLPSERVGMTINQHCFVKNSQFSERGGSDSSPKLAEEKQLFPSSFKICDLNLMEADISEHHHNNPTLSYPNTLETNAEAAQVDIDLSMNNSVEGSRNKSSSKEIEVIDLEDDSAQEGKAVNSLERKNEPMFEGMNGDIADVPDQYDGLTLTEFFRNFSSSPHVPEDINPHYPQNDNINPLQHEDINPMQTGMGLHNGEGTLGDDDSIYMSLGEIPLSFLPAWEQQPAQEYEKPF